jgi:hypothetical protein
MSLFASYTREQLRQTYADCWRKRRERLPLSPLETLIADVIEIHPEYHTLLDSPEAAVGFEPAAGGAQENPFLHMGLHLAVREQIATDRPPGLRKIYQALQERHGDAHAAEHALMQALGESLWEAQRNGRAPDEQHYLERAQHGLDRGN